MYVVKRDGRKELVMFDKITARVRKLCYGLNGLVDPLKVAMRVIEGLYDGVTTSELDNLAAEIAATRIDFREWLRTLSKMQKKAATKLASGETTGAVAELLKVSSGRISSLRRELLEKWKQFQGEDPLDQVLGEAAA